MTIDAAGASDAASSLELEREVRTELVGSEQLLWSAMPRQGMLLRSSDAFAIPFSLLWGGFAIFWELGVLTLNAPLLFKLWGIPFVVVGLYLMLGRFFVDSSIRARTYYAVTDQRILIISGFRSRHVKTLSLRGTSDISLTEKSDRTGTVAFGSALNPFMFNPWGAAWPGYSRRMQPSFDMIENPRAVYELIRTAQQKERELLRVTQPT